jgi:hypothetical protein
MRRTIRLALFAGAALSALGFASSAFASFSPKLVVSSSPGGATRVGVVVNNADDPTARVQIYIPAGYQIATPTPGTKLGPVTATAAAADLGGAVLPLTGALDASDANATADATPIPASAVVGDVELSVPALGSIIVSLSSTAGEIMLIFFLGGLLIAGWFFDELLVTVRRRSPRRTAARVTN